VSNQVVHKPALNMESEGSGNYSSFITWIEGVVKCYMKLKRFSKLSRITPAHQSIVGSIYHRRNLLNLVSQRGEEQWNMLPRSVLNLSFLNAAPHIDNRCNDFAHVSLIYAYPLSLSSHIQVFLMTDALSHKNDPTT
jgi:hypothetical protein